MSDSRGVPFSSALRLKKFWYLLGAVMLLAVGVASLMPVPPQDGVNDKLLHLLTYVVLGAWFALLAQNRAALALSGLGLICYGALIEVLQGLTGYRVAEWGDMLANGLGVALGLMCYPTPLRSVLRWIDKRLAGLWL